MATALTKLVPRFLTMRGSQNGLAGYMQRLVGGQGIKGTGTIGTINIPSGSTSIAVADAGFQTTDVLIVVVQGQSGTPSTYTGYTSGSAGVGYTLNVTANPGTGGVTLLVIRLPAALLFAS